MVYICRSKAEEGGGRTMDMYYYGFKIASYRTIGAYVSSPPLKQSTAFGLLKLL